MEVLHSAPATSSFTPLSTHQSQTPDSFFSGPPVLYHHCVGAILSIYSSDLAAAPALESLFGGAQKQTNGTGAAVNGHASAEGEDEEMDIELEVKGIDIWVTSENFLLYSPTTNTGLSIPYPTISLHAIQRPSPTQPASLFLQLLASAQTFDDHDPEATISISIIPAPASIAPSDTPVTSAPREEPEAIPTEAPSPTQELYAALSACANLHPDPLSDSEGQADEDGQRQAPAIMFEHGGNGVGDISGIYPLGNTDGGAGRGNGLPPPMPGSGGWITAENVGDFFDEEGNWRGGEEWTENEVMGMPGVLGEGAGSVRARGEDEDVVEERDGGGNGNGNGEETKWRRTD